MIAAIKILDQELAAIQRLLDDHRLNYPAEERPSAFITLLLERQDTLLRLRERLIKESTK